MVDYSKKFLRLILKIERMIEALRIKVITSEYLSEIRNSFVDQPISANAWNSIYSSYKFQPSSLKSPIIEELLVLSLPGESLLETGCGSGELSGRLSQEGRKIYLFDFSFPILSRIKNSFDSIHLDLPLATCGDLLKPLPFSSDAVDIVWSSGVLEHWTDEELLPIVEEMVRVCRKKVIAFVPSASSVFYMYGKYLAEKHNIWPYGREIPRDSLAALFMNAGLKNVHEKHIWADQAIEFIHHSDPVLHSSLKTWWDQLPTDHAIKKEQGYLLMTIGEKQS